ncbi:MAG: hypothetical protein WC661_16670 [Opitutaceae bacterium]|jgi:hypothetical protein
MIRLLTLFFLITLGLPAVEEPYKADAFGDEYKLTKTQVRESISRAKQALRTRFQPQGAKLEYFAPGVSTFDWWLGMTYKPLSTPPGTPSYYRFVYQDGYPVANYRHDDTGIHLSTSYYYDQRFFPIVALLQDKKGNPVQIAVLTYDKQDRIKRVVQLNGDWEPMFVTCFVHHGDQSTETWWYYAHEKSGLVMHGLQEGPNDYAFKNGQRLPGPSLYTRFSTLSLLAKFGIRPYPGSLPKS